MTPSKIESLEREHRKLSRLLENALNALQDAKGKRREALARVKDTGGGKAALSAVKEELEAIQEEIAWFAKAVPAFERNLERVSHKIKMEQAAQELGIKL